MDGPGDELLAGAGLTGDQDGRVRRRHLGHVRQDRPERWRGADDLLEQGGLVDLLPEDNALARQPVFQGLDLGVGAVGPGGGVGVDGVREDVQVLHDAGRHQESVLAIPVLDLTRDAIDELLDRGPILGVGL